MRGYREYYTPKIRLTFQKVQTVDDFNNQSKKPAGLTFADSSKSTDQVTSAVVDKGTVKKAAEEVPKGEGWYHLYHAEGGESMIRWLTRVNVLFIGGNSVLLALEFLNPCR